MDPHLDTLIRQEFGLGARDAPELIAHCRDPRLPQFAFEFHAGSQKVYRIDLPGGWRDGVWVPAAAGAQARGRVVAEHCLTRGQFYGFVQTFCRGYLLAAKHAAEGTLGHLAPGRIMAKECDPCPTR